MPTTPRFRFLSYTQEIWKRSLHWTGSRHFSGHGDLGASSRQAPTARCHTSLGQRPRGLDTITPRAEGTYYPFKNYQKIESEDFCFIFAAPILVFAGVPNLVLVSVLYL
jgi:hypothetical protein